MKAIIATGYGSPDVLKFTETSKPTPKENEVLVKIVTSAATTADTMMRTGKPYFARLILGIKKPKHGIPGTGFSGVVEGVGKQVTNFKPGDRVFGETTLGFSANAEYLTISEKGVILHMPDNMDFSEAASFCDGHLTSFNFLREIGKVKAGDKVLINGASGALGTSAVQIAKHLGAKVTAVCSGKNIGLIMSLGADEVLNYQRVDFTQSDEKYDCIYDTVGKSSFGQCKKILSRDGVYLSPVLSFPLLINMLFSAFTNKKAKFQATGMYADDILRTMLDEVVEIYKSGKLKTIIDRQFPLEKLAEAHRYIDSGHKKGNVIIVNA